MSQETKEKDFEKHIESHLCSGIGGYLKRLPEEYDRGLCLHQDELIGFIKDTQPKEYAKLKLQYGTATDEKICQNIANEVNKFGTLHVLRKGFTDRGAKFRLAYFKPASGMNPEHEQLYRKNRFCVVRQVKYSKKDTNDALDIVIFLNGLPIITMELKNSLTGQYVEDAVKQYKRDRDSREPLFQFMRCLVHFAISNEKAFMTTRLEDDKTAFLPFNKDTENPVNPNGHKTAYIWEDILTKDNLLDLIQNYLHLQKITDRVFVEGKGVVEKTKEVLIFPRYHQLDCVRTILSAVKQEGTGKNYLVQHSAGSGKSNSIAWLSHKLASLYQTEKETNRIFDSIIVVTDRTVLDQQLQNTIKQFEQTEGVVRPIDVDSAQLKEALQNGKDIIISTIQKFSVIHKEMESLKGNRFAIIIDEAHSSQSGEASKHLKETLSVNLDDAEKADTVEFDLDDEVEHEIGTRGKQPHISYFAFTATPKNKTLELFGRKNEQGKYVAFHTYTMRQAIEEGFILDVLKNYTTFKRYFKLVKSVEGDKEYEKKKAMVLLTSYVDLKPHAFDLTTRIILEHFMTVTMKAIEGKGRAMLVTKSRLHAVRFQLAFQKVTKELGLPFKSLVAFSGTVIDPDSLAPYTETGMNNLPSKVNIQDALKTPEYRILIAANKFQTGFDEPLLHTMYVDKRLGGVGAVQTLSRLNRTARGKVDTVVLDFVNEWDEIQRAFQDYYQVTYLEEETDPNKLYTLKTQLEQFDVYTGEQVKEFAIVFFNPKEPAERLQPILDKVVMVFEQLDHARQEDFRSMLQNYIRFYAFVSQLITFKDVDLEELYVFAKSLNRKLPRRRTRLPLELQDSVDLDSFRVQQTFTGQIPLIYKDAPIKPIGTETKGTYQMELDFLSNIIKTLNDAYGANLTDEDKVDLGKMREKVNAHQELAEARNSDNTEANVRYKFDKVLDEIMLDFVNNKVDLYKKLSDANVNAFLKRRWFEEFYKGKGMGGNP
jgi:type I restriction enzyme R subunit